MNQKSFSTPIRPRSISRPSPKSFLIQIQGSVFDERGRLHHKGPWLEANSLVKNYFQCLQCLWDNVTMTVVQTNGTPGNYPIQNLTFKIQAAAAITAYGLVIGTGTNPVTVTDYALQAQVTSNITHGLSSSLSESFGTNGWRLTHTRNFINGTGALLSVREVAAYTFSSLGNVMIDRSLYSVDVPANKTLTLNYRVSAGA